MGSSSSPGSSAGRSRSGCSGATTSSIASSGCRRTRPRTRATFADGRPTAARSAAPLPAPAAWPILRHTVPRDVFTADRRSQAMRSWRTPLLSAVGAAALLALIPATTLVAQDAPQDITGIDWQLTSIAVDGTLGPVSEGVTPTLRLDAGDASGSAGCNQFSGGYELEGEALTFEALTSTLMLCGDP